MKKSAEIDGDILTFSCPHCEQEIVVLIKELFCKIFRHAIFKHNFKQIDPHLPKDECDKLVQNDMVFGCAKPFEIVVEDNKYFVQICDYK